MSKSFSLSQQRHSHVKKWTKNLNIFEKDFLIVPINKNKHWFVAIICFPSLNGIKPDTNEIKFKDPDDEKYEADIHITNSNSSDRSYIQKYEKNFLFLYIFNICFRTMYPHF